MDTVKHVVAIVSACMTRQGTPTFALTKVAVTQDELANGINYYLAEAQLLEDGYEEPFVHFAQDEAPPFLFPAVEQLRSTTPTPVLSETC